MEHISEVMPGVLAEIAKKYIESDDPRRDEKIKYLSLSPREKLADKHKKIEDILESSGLNNKHLKFCEKNRRDLVDKKNKLLDLADSLFVQFFDKEIDKEKEVSLWFEYQKRVLEPLMESYIEIIRAAR